MPDLHDLELTLRSGAPIIIIETHEERRAVELFDRVVTLAPKPLFKWTITEGLERVDKRLPPQRHNREPTELLGQIKATEQGSIYLLNDFHPYLDDAVNVRLLKDIALNHHRVDHTVVFISHQVVIPPEVEWFCVRFELSLPNRAQIENIVMAEARAWSKRHPGRHVKTSQKMLDKLVDNLVGMPAGDAKRLARGAIEDDGAITEDDLPKVMKTKFQLLGNEGVLSYEFDTARFADVGGLAQLKEWLELREGVFSGRVQQKGLDIPRGIMLLGVQGCGKSLAAKAVAGAWGTPLLRLDFGALYNKFHGETERNLRESLGQAEAMAPCVLWIDEIEKGISTDGSDSGTSKRMLGTLLTWMAENEERVFIVATANDIQSLPPELLRKGRLDEIFFVDLPTEEIRRLILGIHMRKRDLDPASLGVDEVAEATVGFSGAELEQVIVATLYGAHARNTDVTAALLLEEVTRTRPLSIVMRERISELRAWAAERTVPAN